MGVQRTQGAALTCGASKAHQSFPALLAGSSHPWPQLPSPDSPSQEALINRDKQTSKSPDSVWVSAQKFRNWLGNTVRIGCPGRRPNILQWGWAINTSRIASLIVFWWYLFPILSGWESKVSQTQKDCGINLQACFSLVLCPSPGSRGSSAFCQLCPRCVHHTGGRRRPCGGGSVFGDSECVLRLSRPKASFPFTSLLIPELSRQKTKPAENREEGDNFWLVKVPTSSCRGGQTCTRTGAGTSQGWGQDRGRGTNPAQWQPAINVKPQPETLNVKLKPLLLVWKQILLCF